ncbi:glycosyltransferase [Thermodesulfobacteriota bacterium]
MKHPPPQLSVIIPVLSETETLSALLKNLAAQQGLNFEIIIVDGNSLAADPHHQEEFTTRFDLPIQYLQSEPGRGKQMNRGAGKAATPFLLFLHADTSLDDTLLLKEALQTFQQAEKATPDTPLAGHFGLRFSLPATANAAAYYFYESKTYLNRLDCINGDQGMMISRIFFNRLDGFDESLRYMEDIRLARKIFLTGRWITLPGCLTTSSRRFTSEGLAERQTLNALLKNFDTIGFHSFFRTAEDAYRSQKETGRLQLAPFLRLIHREVREQGVRAAVGLWYKTGRYVADNAWQLAFSLDCRRSFREGLPANTGPGQWLRRYEKWIAPFLTSKLGGGLTALATFIWFYGLLTKLTLIHSGSDDD